MKPSANRNKRGYTARHNRSESKGEGKEETQGQEEGEEEKVTCSC